MVDGWRQKDLGQVYCRSRSPWPPWRTPVGRMPSWHAKVIMLVADRYEYEYRWTTQDEQATFRTLRGEGLVKANKMAEEDKTGVLWQHGDAAILWVIKNRTTRLMG